ncbi:MAG: M48 family metalloprotease [Vicinamibacterales bacterium]
MRHLIAAAAMLVVAAPASAQLGGLGGALKKAQEQKQQIDDLVISESEERTIGQDVSARIRQRFGVVQDPAIHRYVTLVGTALAEQSERPKLAWTFIVLDTDGVNAFASPGGFVHITRGALGLLQNEAELAGVLGHEIGHVARKHTVNAIQKNKAVAAGVNSAAGGRSALLERMANQAYTMVLENSFDRGDEIDADRVGVQLAQKAGYATALDDFLTRLDERNRDSAERNGLFASHPETKERIGKIQQLGAASKSSALVEPRYKSSVKYEVPPIAGIAVVTEGSAGLAGSGQGSGKAAAKSDKKEEPKKRAFGLSALKGSASQEKQSTQVSASGGARGLGADRAAKGGSNPNPVKVAVTPAEVSAFKKGIA